MGGNATIDQAKELDTHAPDTNSSYDLYDYGMGDINVTEIRYGESRYVISGAARNELRMTLRNPALAKLHIPFDEEACKAHVFFNAQSNQPVVDFEETLCIIISTFCEEFYLSKAKPSSIIGGHDSLVAAEAASDQHDSTELHMPEHLENAAEWKDILTQIITSC